MWKLTTSGGKPTNQAYQDHTTNPCAAADNRNASSMPPYEANIIAKNDGGERETVQILNVTMKPSSETMSAISNQPSYKCDADPEKFELRHKYLVECVC